MKCLLTDTSNHLLAKQIKHSQILPMTMKIIKWAVLLNDSFRCFAFLFFFSHLVAFLGEQKQLQNGIFKMFQKKLKKLAGEF